MSRCRDRADIPCRIDRIVGRVFCCVRGGACHRALVSYLAEMAKNRAISYVRRADRRKVVYLGDCDYWEDSRSDVEDSTILKMELDGLQRVWNDLKPETQKILHMKYFLRMPDEDIAREFGIQPRSVRMRLTRARRETKEALERLS